MVEIKKTVIDVFTWRRESIEADSYLLFILLLVNRPMDAPKGEREPKPYHQRHRESRSRDTWPQMYEIE